MRVLVAGATGVLGRPLVAALLDAGHAVRAFSRRPSAELARAAEFIPADLLSSDLEPLVAGCDAVIHAATAIPTNPAAPGAWDLNTHLRTTGTRRLLQAAGTRRYLQQSITMVYADGGDRWLDEAWPFDASPARASVVNPVSDMEAQVRASSADWVILRGGQFTPLRVPRSVPCNGQYYVAPVHPLDVASAFLAALEHAPSGATYNVTAEPVLMSDYLAALQLTPPPSDSPCPPSHRITTAAIRRDLAWLPTHSIYSTTTTPT